MARKPLSQRGGVERHGRNWRAYVNDTRTHHGPCRVSREKADVDFRAMTAAASRSDLPCVVATLRSCDTTPTPASSATCPRKRLRRKSSPPQDHRKPLSMFGRIMPHGSKWRATMQKSCTNHCGPTRVSRETAHADLCAMRAMEFGRKWRCMLKKSGTNDHGPSRVSTENGDTDLHAMRSISSDLRAMDPMKPLAQLGNVYRHRRKWRATIQVRGTNHHGPCRVSREKADADLRAMRAAESRNNLSLVLATLFDPSCDTTSAPVSSATCPGKLSRSHSSLQDGHKPLSQLGSIQRQRSKWRARMYVSGTDQYGPMRVSRQKARADLRAMRAAESRNDVPRVVATLFESICDTTSTPVSSPTCPGKRLRSHSPPQEHRKPFVCRVVRTG